MSNAPSDASGTLAVQEIFLAARELTNPTQRAAYLANACADDAPRRAQVDAMLRQAEQADDFFERDAVSKKSAHWSAEEAGEMIGRYKLLEKIGEGGMGVVYMAEQREPVVRKVALKIIKAGMDTKQVVVRFEAERQALALMDHPNIAKVLDGGETENGRPYFVMDLVQGLPITQFCDEAKLPMHERLELFLEVCSAVQHAHQKGIIHRDIKPSNILVTLHGEKPVPKVIDFGIAKATQQPLTDKTFFTQFQHIIGTPAYMSPEQASLSGLDIDTRSDIYGLGVLLYELLTGTTPFDGKELLKSGLDEMRRTIREKEPLRPSTRLIQMEREKLCTTAGCRRAEAPALVHQLRGDLDWIVMKCLEKDRARRYETANGLAAEINACLKDEPVLARPPSAAYRLQKYLHRHKFQFTAAAAILTVMILGSFISTWQAVKASRAERNARAQSETTQSVKDFLLKQLLGSGDAWTGRAFDTNNYAIVQRIAAEIERGNFTNQPLVEAELRHAVGDALSGMDNFSPALGQYEKAFALRKAFLGEAHSDTLLSASQIGYLLYWLGRHREADRVLDETISKARTASQIKTHGAAEALFTRGWRLWFDGEPAKAMPYLTEALSSFRAALGDNDGRVYAARFVLAACTQHTGQRKQADRLFEEGLRECERTHGAMHSMVPVFLKGHALLRLEENRVQEAISKLERALQLTRDMSGPNNQYTLEIETFLADALEKNGDTNAAIARRVDLARRWAQHLPSDWARGKLRNIADSLVRHQRYEEARAVFVDLQKALNDVPPEKPDEFERLVRARAASEGWSAAAAFCRTNFDRFSDSPSTWLTKAWIFRYVSDEIAYRQVVSNVVSFAQGFTNANDQHMPIEIASLGPYPFTQAQVRQLDSLKQALEISLPARGAEPQAWGYRALALWELRLGHLEQCLKFLEKSASKQANPDPYTLLIKASCLHQLGRDNEATATFADAEKTLKSLLPEPLSEAEQFLPPWQVYQHLLMRREVQAALAGANSSRGGGSPP